MSGAADNFPDQLQKSLTDLAIEGWRFSRLFTRVLSKLDAGEASRYINQYRFYVKRLEEALEGSGLTIVNVEGQRYEAGMAVTAINIEDFAPDDVLLVDQMLEPIIMGADRLHRPGTVMLRRVGQ